MGWASACIERLKLGERVRVRPRGGSMAGRIESGPLCTVEPVADPSALRVDDLVLRRVHGAESLHPVKPIQIGEGGNARFRIGDNRGDINGWTGANDVFGACVKVEP